MFPIPNWIIAPAAACVLGLALGYAWGTAHYAQREAEARKQERIELEAAYEKANEIRAAFEKAQQEALEASAAERRKKQAEIDTAVAEALRRVRVVNNPACKLPEDLVRVIDRAGLPE